MDNIITRRWKLALKAKKASVKASAQKVHYEAVTSLTEKQCITPLRAIHVTSFCDKTTATITNTAVKEKISVSERLQTAAPAIEFDENPNL